VSDPAVLHPTRAAGPEPSARPARLVPPDEAREGAATMPTAAVPAPRRPRGRLGTWALGVGMVALIASWFTAWALPPAILGILLALAALVTRRGRRESAWWGLGLGIAAVACSLFWIAYGLQRAAEVASLG
jgi:hypothetical protein